MAAEALSGAFLKLRRAREKTSELRQIVPDRTAVGGLGALQRALNYNGYTDGYSFLLKNNNAEGTTYLTIKTIDNKEMIQCLVGEIVYQLRSSLDHAVVSLAKLHSPGRSTKSAYFPICDSANQLLSSHRISLLSEQAREVIIGLRPHKEAGGNSLLILLNELRNLDAHLEVVSLSHGGASNFLHMRPVDPYTMQVVAILTGYMASAKINSGASSFDGGITVPMPMKIAEKDHEEILKLLYQGLVLSVFLAIDSVPGCEDKPMVPLLCSLADEVEGALNLLAKHA